jgi:peroxiredoxin
MKSRNTVLALLSCGVLAFSFAMFVPTTGVQAQPGAIEKKIKDKGDEKKDAKKAATAKVGEKAPDFTLTDTDGKTVKLADLLADKDTKAVVIEWFNPECPFVVKQHEKNTTMPDTYKAFKDKGVKWVAINSGAPGKEGAGKELNAKMKKQWNIEYPILLDESGEVGRAYEAKTTPHMFVIKKDGVLAYAGAIDNDKSAAKAGDKNHVKNALESVLKGETVAESETKPYGCSVKYGAKKN